jgi:glycopeptide antibiotics resistance protein
MTIKMNKYENSIAFVAELNKWVRQWTPAIVTASLLLIIVATLFPFNFSFQKGVSIGLVVNSFHHPSDLGDRIRNVLLFVPFGFSITCLLRAKGISGLVTVLTFSAILSLSVEILQVFLPLRSPTIFDIITNSIGGCLGFVCFHFFGLSVFYYAAIASEKIKKYLSIKTLAISFISYFSLMYLIAIALQNNVNLSNWETNFPLSLGNEPVEDHPWQGYVSQVEIADRAFSSDEVAKAFANKSSSSIGQNSFIASYHLNDEGNYRDRAGNISELTWQGQPSNKTSEFGVFLSANGWLKTAAPADAIAQKLQQTNQFTISTVVTTADPFQIGPSRILSFSGNDPYRRNFMLAQDANNLVFRLRSPVTGNNGTYPEMVIPDVFVDIKPYHLIVVFNGLSLRFYIDRLESVYSLDLTPDITFFRYLLFFTDSLVIRLDSPIQMVCKSFYYGVIFIPLGIILASILKIIRGSFLFYAMFVVGGILLPSLILEGILASSINKSVDLGNILLSSSFVTGATFFVNFISRFSQKE